VAADHRQAEARKAIASQVQKRAKSITAKPSNKRSPVGLGVRSDETAAAAYEKMASELGLDLDE